MMQLLDMTDAELTWVTNHFGHNKDIHFQWYRKEDATVEITKIAKILVAIDDGKSLKNKKIDDVLQHNEISASQSEGERELFGDENVVDAEQRQENRGVLIE